LKHGGGGGGSNFGGGSSTIEHFWVFWLRLIQ